MVRPLHALAARGVEVVVADADDTGVLDPDAVESLVRQAPTRALVVQHASNVSGTIQPITDLADIAHAAGALMIVDGAQAGGHLDVDLASLGADVWACSGHKGLLGVQGTGVLYLAPGVDASPLVVGGTGSQSESPEMPAHRPDRYEAGTVNVPGIAGLGAAAHVLAAQGDALRAEERRLARRLHEGLSALGFRVLGPGAAEPRVPVVERDASRLGLRRARVRARPAVRHRRTRRPALRALGTPHPRHPRAWRCGTLQRRIWRDRRRCDLRARVLSDAGSWGVCVNRCITRAAARSSLRVSRPHARSMLRFRDCSPWYVAGYGVSGRNVNE